MYHNIYFKASYYGTVSTQMRLFPSASIWRFVHVPSLVISRGKVMSFITYFNTEERHEQSGAVEACWAHNPEVRGSKPRSANVFSLSFFLKLFVRCEQVKQLKLPLTLLFSFFLFFFLQCWILHEDFPIVGTCSLFCKGKNAPDIWYFLTHCSETGSKKLWFGLTFVCTFIKSPTEIQVSKKKKKKKKKKTRKKTLTFKNTQVGQPFQNLVHVINSSHIHDRLKNTFVWKVKQQLHVVYPLTSSYELYPYWWTWYQRDNWELTASYWGILPSLTSKWSLEHHTCTTSHRTTESNTLQGYVTSVMDSETERGYKEWSLLYLERHFILYSIIWICLQLFEDIFKHLKIFV